MSIKSFSDFLTEETKEVSFVFGRFNPPTIGHEKLFEYVKKISRGGTYRIYASKSQDPKKNPLNFKEKIKFLRKMFPKSARNIMSDKDVRTALDVVVKLYDQGFTKATMVVGSDRVNEFRVLLNKYNGKKSRHGFYNFESGINVVSAGERDPDADGATGMSASKMRGAAQQNDLQLFAKGLPSNYNGLDLFNAVRKGMGLKESHNFRNHIELPPVSETREEYIEGNLFKSGDMVRVKESNEIGEILLCGSNYVLVETESVKKRYWLDDVELTEDYGAGFIGTKKLLKKYMKDTPFSEKKQEDPDIGKERKGQQPKGYYAKDAKGKEMKKSTKLARARHFAKYGKMDDDNPRAYKKAPGDASAKTKPSKHTNKFKQMYGEMAEHLTFEDFLVEAPNVDKALKKKADKSGMPLGILRKVFNRGVAAWKTGHRPGTNSVQWGLARVNSFTTKSKGTWGGADKDLAAKVRG
tara:strand:- start:17368 stop:18768 length:1401 start_codon:yes stop_codon:yes gene_type:complete